MQSAGILEPDRVAALQRAYRFLRTLEHRLQYLDDQQTQMLPGGEEAGQGEPVLDLRTVRDAAERRAVTLALARSDGNIAKAADLLGVSRPTLYDLMKKLGLQAAV